MQEIPEIPSPPPEVPKGKLWVSLLMPPAVTVLLTFFTGITIDLRNYGIEFLYILPFCLVAIVFGQFAFTSAWRTRYRGRTLVLTSIGYFLGQIVLCLGLWFGCCLIPYQKF